MDDTINIFFQCRCFGPRPCNPSHLLPCGAWASCGSRPPADRGLVLLFGSSVLLELSGLGAPALKWLLCSELSNLSASPYLPSVFASPRSFTAPNVLALLSSDVHSAFILSSSMCLVGAHNAALCISLLVYFHDDDELVLAIVVLQWFLVFWFFLRLSLWCLNRLVMTGGPWYNPS